MIHSDEVRRLDEQQEMYYLATSYLSASEYLCESMISEDFPKDFGRSRVILGLCHHGIELYLKAALMAANISYKHIHNLKKLYEEYRKTYPEVDFDVPEIFGYESGGLFPEHEHELYKTLHQRYRYSSDVKGQRWSGMEGFIPELFLEEVSSFKNRAGLAWVGIETNASKDSS